jgi:predicted  nucleic acid-binding Zn-ribbon protein
MSIIAKREKRENLLRQRIRDLEEDVKRFTERINNLRKWRIETTPEEWKKLNDARNHNQQHLQELRDALKRSLKELEDEIECISKP